jgi:cell division protease FtsH
LREAEQTLNQVLVELDGFEPRTGVILMAATNRPDLLDRALLRPGRIDRRVEIGLPDRAGRKAILELHARGKPMAGVDLEVVAGLCQGFSGADLANVLNEAALLATRRGLSEISMELVDEGIDRATLGITSRSHLMSADERWVVAIHETGHALVARALPHASQPYRLTIVPRPGSLGHVRNLDGHDRVIARRSMLIDEMASLLGGIAAEELVFGESGSGAAGDLAQVSEIARRMVRQYGMGEGLGAVSYPETVESGGVLVRTHSDVMAGRIDEEVVRLVDEALQRARNALASSSQDLERIATELIDKETLSLEDLSGLLDGNRIGSN